MIEWIKYIILGIIQGITEILPISSSGHLTIFSNLFGLDVSSLTVFLMLTNTGSFLAIFIYFRKDILSLIRGGFIYLFKGSTVYQEDFTYLVKVFLAVLPVGIIGLLFEDILPNDLLTVGVALTITGALLLFIYLNRHFEYNKNIDYKNAIVVGLFQMFAIIPGISRSGITLTGGLVQKIPLKKSLRFSFISYAAISLPVSILSVFRLAGQSESIHLGGYILATLLSFIFSYLAVHWLYQHVRIKNLIYFAVYCFFIGLLSMLLYFI